MQVDVLVAQWSRGPELLVSTKSMVSSFRNNLPNRFEETYGEAKNLRGRLPLVSMGFLFLLRSTVLERAEVVGWGIHRRRGGRTRIWVMALGVASVRQRFENPVEVLGDRLRVGSLYKLLADEGHRLFPDDYFADLFTDSPKGRPTVLARVMATVMVLQAFAGLSDREACDRLSVDLRWQAAAGVDVGAESFHPTLLVAQRSRLRKAGWASPRTVEAG